MIGHDVVSEMVNESPVKDREERVTGASPMLLIKNSLLTGVFKGVCPMSTISGSIVASGCFSSPNRVTSTIGCDWSDEEMRTAPSSSEENPEGR